MSESPSPKVQVRKSKSESPSPKVQVRKCKSESASPKVQVQKSKSESQSPKVQVRKSKSESPSPKVQVRKSKFVWSQELNDSFEKSKGEILEAVKQGVKTFDTSLPTVLSTDWSKEGVGFCLLQKTCSCNGPISPVCCRVGWRLTLCNSRFTRDA